MADAIPVRDPRHDALAVFLGAWTAVGTSFGGPDQLASEPRSNGQPWASTHRGAWHPGRFFLIQDERTVVAGGPFDTLSVMGVDPDSGEYFARAFENHGFYRNYRVTRDGDVWSLHGESERARIAFQDDDRTQVLAWEWKRDGVWLPLCDRTAKRVD